MHCSCKKVFEKPNYENLKVIKNNLLNKLGNPESLKKEIIIAAGKLFN